MPVLRCISNLVFPGITRTGWQEYPNLLGSTSHDRLNPCPRQRATREVKLFRLLCKHFLPPFSQTDMKVLIRLRLWSKIRRSPIQEIVSESYCIPSLHCIQLPRFHLPILCSRSDILLLISRKSKGYCRAWICVCLSSQLLLWYWHIFSIISARAVTPQHRYPALSTDTFTGSLWETFTIPATTYWTHISISWVTLMLNLLQLSFSPFFGIPEISQCTDTRTCSSVSKYFMSRWQHWPDTAGFVLPLRCNRFYSLTMNIMMIPFPIHLNQSLPWEY